MKKKIYGRILLILIVLSFCGWQGEPGCKPPPPPPGLPELIKAIYDLSSDDYVVVRQAILSIEKNINNPLTKSAVDPLIEIVKNSNGRRDAYTRQLAVPVLFRIGVTYSPGWQSHKAINAVIDLLHHSSADMVRGACADAIGLNNYQEAISDLEEALNDSSVYVQEEACMALLRMTNYSYSSPNCNPPPEQNPTQSESIPNNPSAAAAGAESEDKTDLIYSWLRSHVLYPSIDELQK